ncbi:MAG: YebC/PmpR family DNA-binding transcriptional regulator [Clostridia bacterium]|nr:YebC/PmpR family DNA-binding transcriptional regulator [Clostridia bacterium]
MSGHSKWANIKHRKARMDEKRGRLFTKLGREIMVAAKMGGGDPENNPRLKMAIQKAREANMSSDSIARLIGRATGGGSAVENYEELVYEGYGPGGVAVLMNILTDNRNRTAAELRYIFSRHGGSLGEAGCVAWMFDQKGLVVVEMEGHDEDEVLMLALDAGAEDVNFFEGVAEITANPADLPGVKKVFADSGYRINLAEVTMVPKTVVSLDDVEQARKIMQLTDALEDHDDVQAVYMNYVIPADVMAKCQGKVGMP